LTPSARPVDGRIKSGHDDGREDGDSFILLRSLNAGETTWGILVVGTARIHILGVLNYAWNLGKYRNSQFKTPIHKPENYRGEKSLLAVGQYLDS
jgi:hypothetical protein